MRIAVAVTISGGSVEVDFTGTTGESHWGLNVPFNLSRAEALYALKVILGPDIPLLEGSMRPFSVTAPEGSILNPRPPAPTMLRTIVVHNVCGAVSRPCPPWSPNTSHHSGFVLTLGDLGRPLPRRLPSRADCVP